MARTSHNHASGALPVNSEAIANVYERQLEKVRQ